MTNATQIPASQNDSWGCFGTVNDNAEAAWGTVLADIDVEQLHGIAAAQAQHPGQMVGELLPERHFLAGRQFDIDKSARGAHGWLPFAIQAVILPQARADVDITLPAPGVERSGNRYRFEATVVARPRRAGCTTGRSS